MTEDYIQCGHCARCLEVCPTYQALRIETLSSRGRWDLINGVAEGTLQPGPRYWESLSLCMNCMACSAVCPKGVDPERMVREARAKLARGSGKDRLKRALFSGFLSHPRAVRGSLRPLRLLTKVRRCFRGRGDRFLRPLPLILSDFLKGYAIPTVSGPSLFDLLPSRVPAAPDADPRGEVAYFAGCFNALVDTGPAEAAIRVLSHQGYDVLVPPGQTCCGAPVLHDNAGDLIRRAMEKNLQAFAGDRPVVVSCATCGSMLKKQYPELAAGDGGPLSGAAADLAGRTVDFMELLAGAGGVRPGRIPVRQRVTIHDPCHLARGQGISAQVRQVLGAVPGIEIVEMDHPDRCCGGGGTYSVGQPEMARAIGLLKVNEIKDTGATLVVTACPGCVLQIQRELAREGLRIPVVQPAEVLAFSYGFGREMTWQQGT
ncbi:MAG: (Fe-S)-binding protein [Holophaga sp.]|jgi:glycolate oxidase iron-sulfur subunit